jgi:peptide/nickel transport system substrate-binding protein
MMSKKHLALILAFFFLMVCPRSAQTQPFEQKLVALTTGIGGANAMPHTANLIELHLWGGVNECLIYLNRDGSFGPGLAERWKISDDHKRYTFHLRKGISFHGGWGELTAEDIKFSFELTMRKDSLSTIAPYLREIVDNILVDNTHQVTVVLKRPDWQLLDKLNPGHPYVPIVSKKYVEKVGEKEANLKPIGSGPYKLIQYMPGEFIRFEAVSNHWRRTPDFKWATIKAVPELSTRIAMLKAGQADLTQIPTDRVAEIEKAGYKTFSNPGSKLYWVVLGSLSLPTKTDVFDPKIPWWADYRNSKEWERAKKVRKAMSLAINRKEILDTILLGKGALFGASHFWPNSPGNDPRWNKNPYAPEEAKRLLGEAGYPKGFEVTMVLVKHSGRPEAPMLGEAVAMYWEKIGLKVKRLPEDFTTLRPRMFARKVKECWVFGQGWETEPIIGLTASGRSTSQYFTDAEHPLIDDMISKAGAEMDSKKRHEMTRQIGQLSYENYLTIPLVATENVWAVSKRVADWLLIPGMNYDAQLLEYATYKR